MDEKRFFILLFDWIIIPSFQHSNLFALRSRRALRLLFFSSSPGVQTKKDSYNLLSNKKREKIQ